MALQLLVTGGPDNGKVHTVQPGINLMLGRSPQSQYQINDPSVSRSHCQVLLEGEQVTIIDNKSSSGTFVNNKKVARTVLKLGDVLKVGNSELRLQMGDFPLNVALGAVKQSGAVAAVPA